ncbi:MAG: hypothetical protein KC418_17255 [Anaerolineales bacterium]|nr:hypothetical protein [Anaerolineales bacterium]MCB8951573.1 hypothetical protein [Ardenticatenales bacterium]
MKQWLRRTGCLLLILFWLFLMSLPLLAVNIARGGQVRLGAQDGAHLRIFLVQEEKLNGLGLEWARDVAGTGTCRHTSVTYLMWEGQGTSADYCQCDDGAPCP